MDNKVYIFEKQLSGSIGNEAIGHLLGECQSNFNMAMVLDGTRDTMKIEVLSFQYADAIEPWTILQHLNTNTWWIVKHDKVERYLNDNGYIYKHSLQLEGAIELLNARDLTDCAFNQGDYAVVDVIYRLFALSNFEFAIYNISTDLNPNIKLDHIKTFENYTLLSALREFLDEYNYCAKLVFNAVGNPDDPQDTYYIEDCTFTFIAKTGRNLYAEPLDIEYFNIAKEIQTVDKNSFGSTVISNADNVISTLAKTYPSVGAVRLSSEEWNITTKNAILRLPSPAFKVNWVSVSPAHPDMNIEFMVGGASYSALITDLFNNMVCPAILGSIENALYYLYDYVVDRLQNQYEIDEFTESFYDNISEIAKNIRDFYTTRVFQDNVVNANTGEIEQGANVPYLAKIDISDGSYVYRNCTVADKETANMLKYQNQALYWERGSRIINGFGGFASKTLSISEARIAIQNGLSTDYQSNATRLFSYESTSQLVHLVIDFNVVNEIVYSFKESQWRVNYIPMSDIKIKLDNENDRRDIQLYNQNGKLTDSVALSKLLNSYSNEISSINITRYKNFYSWSAIPKIGQLVLKNNDEYVINNISYDFHQNDDGEYFIECEFTMSKNVATKSLMTSPNTNIRDYGIPQKYNVKRKQVYRDYFELAYAYDNNANNETPYFATSNIFNFGTYPAEEQNDFICQMEIVYDHYINGNDRYYYQLETTTYILDKSKYIVCDFQDNNIIGYGFMNMYGGFDVAKLFDPTVSVNTPISYVDEYGKFERINLVYLTPNKLEKNIEDYKIAVNRQNETVSIYNASVFIDEILYAISSANFDIKIEDSEYYKDALEVPVFEYCMQVGNNNDVKIGSAIFNENKDCVYLYAYVKGNNLNENNVFNSNNINDYSAFIELNNVAVINFDQIIVPGSSTENVLRITNHSKATFRFKDGEPDFTLAQDFDENVDYAFFRYSFNLLTRETTKELLFIAKNVPETALSLDKKTLTLFINHWKLK